MDQTTSAKLYFIVFMIGCVAAFPLSSDTSSAGTENGSGASSVVASLTAAGPQGESASSIDLIGSSWNSVNGYITQGGDYNYGSGNVNGGASVWGQAAGQTISADAVSQSESQGSSTYEITSKKKKDDNSMSVNENGGSSASAVLTGSANSEDISTFSLNVGVNTGDSLWANSPPPSSNAGVYANANGNLSGTGDVVTGSLTLENEVNPAHASSDISTASEKK